MVFSIAQYTNLTNEQNSWIVELSNELESFFEFKSYGNDLNELYFGLITVKPEFEQFYKKRKPRYRPGERTTTIDSISVKSVNCVEIDVKIDFADISVLEKNKMIELVCKNILTEIDCLTRLSKLKDFDYPSFKSDFVEFLKKKNINV